MKASLVKGRMWKMAICLGVGIFLIVGLLPFDSCAQSDQNPVVTNDHLQELGAEMQPTPVHHTGPGGPRERLSAEYSRQKGYLDQISPEAQGVIGARNTIMSNMNKLRDIITDQDIVHILKAKGYDDMAIKGLLGQAGAGMQEALGHLAQAKVYMMAGDYRRAVEACQENIDRNPSAEAYVYLAYVYQAIDGYLGSLAKQEDYVKVEQLALNLTARDILDLIDPPNLMPRMAQELIHEGIRQQFDLTAAMANRLSRTRTDELWAQQTRWRELKPDSWWTGTPDEWQW